MQQIAEVAAAYPNGSVVLVGPMQDEEHFAAGHAAPECRLAGVAPRRDVVGLVGAADACLIPHVGSRLTEAMSPLKLYEYLAAGRPVAAVDLSPIAAVAVAWRSHHQAVNLRRPWRRRWRSAPQPRPSASSSWRATRGAAASTS